jgi:hypothetical protein
MDTGFVNTGLVKMKKKSLRCLHRIIAMSLEEHRDVFGKPLGRLFYIIAKTFFYDDKDRKKTS